MLAVFLLGTLTMLLAYAVLMLLRVRVELLRGSVARIEERRFDEGAGLGAEPMSAPPNALATGELIVRLEPGEEHVALWGVRLR